jgi:hypothetical protein
MIEAAAIVYATQLLCGLGGLLVLAWLWGRW